MNSRSIEVSNDIFIPQVREMIAEGHTARFRVRGRSMRIFVEHERDEVLLGACNVEVLQLGDVVLAEVSPKRYALHRIVAIKGEEITMQGDGNVGVVEQFHRSKVIGIALGFYRKGRAVPDLTTGGKWKLYSYIWLTLTPIRRYILAFYNRIWLRFFKPL